MVAKAKGKAKDVPAALLNVADVAEILGVDRRTVFRYISSGKLKARRLSPQTLRFKREDVDAFIDKR